MKKGSFLLAILLLLSMCACSTTVPPVSTSAPTSAPDSVTMAPDPTETPQPEPSSAPQKDITEMTEEEIAAAYTIVSTDEIAQAFLDDENAAAGIYSEKPCVIVGVVEDIFDSDSGASLSFFSYDESAPPVVCLFDNENKTALIGVSAFGFACIVGTYDKYADNQVFFRDCEVLDEQPIINDDPAESGDAISGPVTAPARDFPAGEYEDTGAGTFYISTPSGTSEDGSIPVLFAASTAPETDFIQIGFDTRDFDGAHLTYVYVDGVLNCQEQVADSSSVLGLSGYALTTGLHTVEAVQYDTDQPDGQVITYKVCQYEVREF